MTRPTTITRFLLAVSLAVLSLGAACGDSTPTGTDGGSLDTTPQASALIDGGAWKANYQVDVAIGDFYPAQQRMEINVLEIASDNSGRQISLVIRGFNGPGTYAFDVWDRGGPFAYLVTSPNIAASAAERDQRDVTYASLRTGAGTITVTSYDASRQWIVGSFSVEVAQIARTEQVARITNGIFAGRVNQGS